tara:strand:- start:56 stop:235 length:180 start_codon:yes stop_codon:yes gene_type:complete
MPISAVSACVMFVFIPGAKVFSASFTVSFTKSKCPSLSDRPKHHLGKFRTIVTFNSCDA